MRRPSYPSIDPLDDYNSRSPIRKPFRGYDSMGTYDDGSVEVDLSRSSGRSVVSHGEPQFKDKIQESIWRLKNNKQQQQLHAKNDPVDFRGPWTYNTVSLVNHFSSFDHAHGQRSFFLCNIFLIKFLQNIFFMENYLNGLNCLKQTIQSKLLGSLFKKEGIGLFRSTENGFRHGTSS